MISRQGLFFRFVTRLAIFGLCAVALVACGSASDDEVSGITEPQSEETDQSNLNGSSDSESSETVEEEPNEVVEEESVEVVEEESVDPETVEVEADPPIEEETVETDDGMTSAEQEALIESILLDSYLWGSGTAFKTIQLQEALELNADGSYGPQTRVAHLLALEERGLPTANVPEEPPSLPTTTAPEEPSGATPPSSPTTLLVAPGDSLAKLTWTGSEESGGIPLVGYTATATPGGQKCETTGTSCDITGLTNGTSYTFVVTASNGEFISDESSTVAVTPGIPNSVFNNLDNCTESEDYCSSGGIKIDWSANQGSGSNDTYSYLSHLITDYYNIGGGDGHGGTAWKDNRNVEIIDVTHDGTCVQLTEFYIRVENDRWAGEYEDLEVDELTIELPSAILYLYKDGVLIGSQNTNQYMSKSTLANTQRVPISAGLQTSCLDQIRIVYDITGTCDLDATSCLDQDDDASLKVMTDDWTFNKWS
jgi:hypothetical protein